MGQGRSPKASLLVEEMLGEEESVLSGDVASCMLPLPQCTTLHPNTYGSILIGLSEFYIQRGGQGDRIHSEGAVKGDLKGAGEEWRVYVIKIHYVYI